MINIILHNTKLKLLKFIKELKIEQEFLLDSGHCKLNIPKVSEMLKSIEGKGNFYILFCGASCYNDMIIDDEIEFMLYKMNIFLLYDYRINNNMAYLIPLKNWNQKRFIKSDITKFNRGA